MSHDHNFPSTRHSQLDIKPLLVIGGQSSRMGKSKHLLFHPDGRTALEHTIETVRAAMPDADTIYLSISDKNQLDAIKHIIPPISFGIPQTMAASDINNDTKFSEHDHATLFQHTIILLDEGTERIGPASALRSAYLHSQSSTWLMLGCDYPLLPASAILQLIMDYNEPASCFMQRDSDHREWMEPLISVWSPEATKAMYDSIQFGNTGPTRVLKQLNAKEIWPLRSEWIKGANTPEEWAECYRLLSK